MPEQMLRTTCLLVRWNVGLSFFSSESCGACHPISSSSAFGVSGCCGSLLFFIVKIQHVRMMLLLGTPFSAAMVNTLLSTQDYRSFRIALM